MIPVFSRALGPGGILISALFLGAGTAWAGCLVPAPLVGVSGPYGIVAAVVGCGGYLLFRRLRDRD